MCPAPAKGRKAQAGGESRCRASRQTKAIPSGEDSCVPWAARFFQDASLLSRERAGFLRLTNPLLTIRALKLRRLQECTRPCSRPELLRLSTLDACAAAVRRKKRLRSEALLLLLFCYANTRIHITGYRGSTDRTHHRQPRAVAHVAVPQNVARQLRGSTLPRQLLRRDHQRSVAVLPSEERLRPNERIGDMPRRLQ